MVKRFSIVVLLLFTLISLHPQTGFAQKTQSVPTEFVRNFLGAVHLNAKYHPYANKIGIQWGRQGAQWDKIEPQKGQFNFEKYDRLVESGEDHDLRFLTVLNHSALWASSAPEGVDNRDKYAPAEKWVPRWKKYVETVVERYPQVEYFEVWNEPNIDWFLRSKDNYQVYVDRILKPAAEVIHNHGRKVVGLSFTTEWPLDSWPARERPRKYSENVESNKKAIARWLNYHDAWKYVDILSFHYTHGDVGQKGNPHADNMMAFYDYLYQEWIKPGKLEGAWDTEEGFGGVEAGMQGFVSLDYWEHPPLSQWAARYTIPVLHWAIEHDWQQRDQYKVFWYHMSKGGHPRDMLRPGDDGSPTLSQSSRALQTIISELGAGDSLGTYEKPVKVGFGLRSQDTTAINYFAPYTFKSYAFTQDDGLFIASWLHLPKIKQFGQPVQVKVQGIQKGSDISIQKVDHLTGERKPVDSYQWIGDQTLFVQVPPTNDPVLYLKIRQK